MNHGPIPSQLAFISDLPSLRPGTKVRFLGCVTDYALSTGILTLQHAYPSPPHPCATVRVDARILLENMKSNDTRIGEWVNVMGYIERGARIGSAAQDAGSGPRAATSAEIEHAIVGNPDVRAREMRVQAVMLWSAGAIRLGEYESNLEERKRIGHDAKAGAKR